MNVNTLQNDNRSALEEVTLDGFESLTVSDMNTERLPWKIAANLAITGIGISANGEGTVVLKKQQKDGICTYIKVETFRGVHHGLSLECSGEILDAVGEGMVGHTHFSGLVESNDIDVISIGANNTQENFQRKGLGERRLRLANEYLKTNFRKFLHSDSVRTDSADAAWIKLVRKGLAEPESYPDGTTRRYRFVK